MDVTQIQKKAERIHLKLFEMGIEHSYECNKLKMKTLVLKPSPEGQAIFNSVIEMLEGFGYGQNVVLTKSGGFRKINHCGYAIRNKRSYKELIASTCAGNFRVLFDAKHDVIEEGGMSGREAFQMMTREFKKDGIDISDYATDDGAYLKQTIEKPIIQITSSVKTGETYDHVHHLDIHSAYPSGLAANHPELRPTIERIYEQRKTGDNGKRLKLALDASIGYFQSEYCKVNKMPYALATLSREAIRWCNRTIVRLTSELRRQGYTPLGYNTDGIWYARIQEGKTIPSEPMHCSLEGDCLGTYANDHADCRIRWKSKGSYEYVENGVYKPVVRGATRLDQIKDRSHWQWGDIFQDSARILKYDWNPNTHRIEDKEE